MANYFDIQTVMSTGRQLKHTPTYRELLDQVEPGEKLVGVYIKSSFNFPFLLRFPYAHAVELDSQREYDAWECEYREGRRTDRRWYAFKPNGVG